MKNNLNHQIKLYLKKIRNLIPRNYPNKKLLMDTIKRNLDDFITEHPMASFQDIIEEFGSASDIADSFMEEISGMEIAKSFRKKRKILTFSTIVCFLSIVIFIFVFHYIYNWWKNDAVFIEETMYIFDGTEMPTEWEEKVLNGEPINEN